MSHDTEPSFPLPAAVHRGPLYPRGGLGRDSQSIHASDLPRSGLFKGGVGGEGANESPNLSHSGSPSPTQGFSRRPGLGAGVFALTVNLPLSLSKHTHTHTHTRSQERGAYKRSRREWRVACRAGLASRTPREEGLSQDVSPEGARPAPQSRGPGPGRDTRAGAAGTHQLLQVLLRELRVTVSLLLELVPGGFGHHHHPGRAEAAVGAATTARQLARLPLPWTQAGSSFRYVLGRGTSRLARMLRWVLRPFQPFSC